jgi:3-oxoacyl-[acyl-carrier-protein] synthase III
VYIDAVGVFLPDWVDAADAVADGRYKQEVHAESGLTGTHIANGVSALDMAVNAARAAIERSEVDIEDIEALIHSGVYYQGPEGSYPPGYLLRELGVGSVPSFYVQQGCNGMLAALELAVGQITGAAGLANVLLTTGQNFNTPLIDRWHGFGDSYILADGAAAALISSDSGFAEVRSVNSGVLPDLEKWHRGNESLLPPTGEQTGRLSMAERAAQFTDNELPMSEAVENLSGFDLGIVQRSLVDADLNIDDLAKVIPINEDGRMVEFTTMGPLGLPMSSSTWEFGKSVGHVGAADLIISLEHLVLTGEVTKGDHVLLLSQGPGWICSSAVLTICDEPSWDV